MIEEPERSRSDVTRLLLAWTGGDKGAFERLMPLVFEELRRIAGLYLGREDSRHTLQPTALVNELYLRLVGKRKVKFHNRAHFFGTAAVSVYRSSDGRGGWVSRGVRFRGRRRVRVVLS